LGRCAGHDAIEHFANAMVQKQAAATLRIKALDFFLAASSGSRACAANVG